MASVSNDDTDRKCGGGKCSKRNTDYHEGEDYDRSHRSYGRDKERRKHHRRNSYESSDDEGYNAKRRANSFVPYMVGSNSSSYIRRDHRRRPRHPDFDDYTRERHREQRHRREQELLYNHSNMQSDPELYERERRRAERERNHRSYGYDDQYDRYERRSRSKSRKEPLERDRSLHSVRERERGAKEHSHFERDPFYGKQKERDRRRVEFDHCRHNKDEHSHRNYDECRRRSDYEPYERKSSNFSDDEDYRSYPSRINGGKVNIPPKSLMENGSVAPKQMTATAPKVKLEVPSVAAKITSKPKTAKDNKNIRRDGGRIIPAYLDGRSVHDFKASSSSKDHMEGYEPYADETRCTIL